MDVKPPRKSATQAGVARNLADRLESLQRAGLTHMPRSRNIAARPAPATTANESGATPVGSAQIAADARASVKAQLAVAASSSSEPIASDQPLLESNVGRPIVPAGERPAQLEIIRREVAACTRCGELASTRSQTVFGVGDSNARLMFIGEAPGADEDRQGEPFVGKAGQLLTKIIEACRLKREEVYIANVIKCRPPGNRNPLPDEVTNCRGYLERQLAIIRPEYICCLGSVAARSLLNTEATIGRLRGRFDQFEGIPVLCTYHPAYLLRNPSAKRDVWEDMKILMGRMGVEL